MDKPVKKVVLDVSGHFPDEGKKKKVVTEKIWNKQNSRKAPVTALHSYCMRHQIDVPHIELINSEGEAHKPIFTMLCQVSLRGEIVSAEGKGTKKIAAKHESAARMLELLQKDYIEQKRLQEEAPPGIGPQMPKTSTPSAAGPPPTLSWQDKSLEPTPELENGGFDINNVDLNDNSGFNENFRPPQPMAPQAPPEWINTEMLANTPVTTDNRTKNQKKRDNEKHRLARRKAEMEAKKVKKKTKGWSGWDDNSNWEPPTLS